MFAECHGMGAQRSEWSSHSLDHTGLGESSAYICSSCLPGFWPDSGRAIITPALMLHDYSFCSAMFNGILNGIHEEAHKTINNTLFGSKRVLYNIKFRAYFFFIKRSGINIHSEPQSRSYSILA